MAAALSRRRSSGRTSGRTARHGSSASSRKPSSPHASSWLRLLPLLLLGLLALVFTAESRRLSTVTGSPADAVSTWRRMFLAVGVPPPPQPTFGAAGPAPQPPAVPPPPPPPVPPAETIKIVVSDMPVRSSSSIGGSTGGSGSSGGNGGDADLMGPMVARNVTGLFANLPPNSTAAVSSFGLKIDDMVGLVVPKGYPLEQHVVVTGDGYKLGTFRIPYGRSGQGGGRRPPVLLIHGISLASTCWVVNRPEESLAFILADKGYDVWMMNTRGNTFSREHVTLRDTQSKFWKFSADEMAHIDFRETLKYVQGVTGAKKIGVVGHSQGGTLALMAISADPYLSESISTLVAMGPCAYVKHMTSVILGSFCRQANTTEMTRVLPPQELIYMSAEMQQTFLDGACQLPGTMLSCLTTMEGIFGPSRRISAAQYRRYWQIWPSSTSLGNGLQWSEMYNEPTPRFFRFRYGAEYDLTKVKTPVVMLSGSADVLAASEDIAQQVRNLGSAIRSKHVIPGYSHMDFIWDTSARKTIYPIVMDALESSFA